MKTSYTTFFGSLIVAASMVWSNVRAADESSPDVSAAPASAKLPSFPLTVDKAGTGSGSVTVTPRSSSGSYIEGTRVTLTAVPAAGSTFSGWSGGVSGSAKTVSVKILTNTMVTATFTLIPHYTLTIDTAGAGAGSVTVSPKGSSFAQGTVVTLTAVPEKGCAFASWSGAASGTAPSVKVKINGDTTVTANFKIKTVTGTDYVGTWLGQFNIQYSWTPDPTTPVTVQGSRSFNVTITVKPELKAAGFTVMKITEISTDDEFFGCGSGCVAGLGSTAVFPSAPANASKSGVGFVIFFANGATLGTINDPGDAYMVPNGSVISNSVEAASIGSGCWEAASPVDAGVDYLGFYGVTNATIVQTTWSFTHTSL